MGEVKNKVAFELPDKQVQVRFIKRKKGMASGAHIGDDHVISGNMLETAVRRFTVPLRRKGGLVNVLTDIEKDFLEKATGLNLSIYSDFWINHFVTLRKQTTTFDLSKPLDYIAIKLLKANKDKIAVGWENRNLKLTYDFVIVEEGEEQKSNKKKFDIVKKAWKEYSRIEEEKDILRAVLKLLESKPISKKSKIEWLQSKVENIVDNRPKDFLKLVTDKTFTTQLFLDECLEAGVVVRAGNKYSTADGIPLSEENQLAVYKNAVAFLDNVKHQDVRAMLEAKLNVAKED